MPTFSDATVLLVDDSSTMRTIVREMLCRLDVRSIEEAESGETALAMLRNRSFSLIISDWHMEGMSGLDLLREFRLLRRPGLSHFIFATSERSYGHQTSAKMDGADAFITKPFKLETLRAKMQAVLKR